MLIKCLYDLAQTRGLLKDVHLQERAVHMLIPIAMDGSLQGESLIPLYSKDAKGKERLGRDMPMPRFPSEKNGGKACFLADSVSAVLGINKENGDALTVEGGRLENHAKSHLHFWKQVDDAYETTKNPVIEALLRFKNRYLPIRDEKVSSVLPFVEIRRNKRGEPEVGGKTNAGDWVRFEMVTITFQVEGRIVFNGADSTDTLTEYWREAFGEGAFAAEMNDAEVPTATSKGVCMVTGEPDVPIARSHKPKLLGVPGIGSGGYIVSFAKECPAFSSYGFEKQS